MINNVGIAVFIKSWVHSFTFHLDCLEVRADSFKASKFAINSSMSMSMGSVSSFVFDPTSIDCPFDFCDSICCSFEACSICQYIADVSNYILIV